MCISDSVVRPIVVATARSYRSSPQATTPSAMTAMTRPRLPSRIASERFTIGALASLGRRFIRPGTAASKPRPIASTTSIAKLIQRICSGVSGAPLATSKTPATTNGRMNAPSTISWIRTYFIRLS